MPVGVPTVPGFLAAHREYKSAPRELVQLRLDQAVCRTATDVWGDLYCDGVYLMAAHLLSLSPEAKDMALKDGDGNPMYLAERERIGCAAATLLRAPPPLRC